MRRSANKQAYEKPHGTGMTEIVSLENDALRLEVAPRLGGAVLRFDALGRHRVEPVFRPTAAADIIDDDFEPNRLACYPLVPWVSRLCPPILPTSAGPLTIPASWPGEIYPLHGWGARAVWQVLARDDTTLRLGLDHQGPPPFSAELDYALFGSTLSMALTVVNRFDRAVGLGLGLHPWLPRHEGGCLYAPARHVWMSGADKIPFAAETPPDDWDFSQERPLPDRDLDHGFGGWTGTAHYTWQGRGGSYRLDVESPCDHYIIYAPAGRTFFCFEPTTHKPSPGQSGELDGLVMVEPGETLRHTARFTITVR
jgi:aldose 1-epimerase